MEKFLWFTDPHLLPWNRYKMLSVIHDEKVRGVFLTGDISHSGFTILDDLEFLGKRIGRPLYFVMGNHDYWSSSFDSLNQEVKHLCNQYSNLIWMDQSGIVPLNETSCLIGNMGWYDARIGSPKYLKFTFDWFLINDFRKLSSMEDRIRKFRELAEQETESIIYKLEKAIETYKTIYLLTHFPCYPEANRCYSKFDEEFWMPYNCNMIMGHKINALMEQHKKKHLIILSGHVHIPCTIYAARNIECRVGKGSYLKVSEEQVIYI